MAGRSWTLGSIFVAAIAIAGCHGGSGASSGSACASSYVALTYAAPLPIVAGVGVWYDPGDDGTTTDEPTPPDDSSSDPGNDTTDTSGGDGTDDGSGAAPDAVRLHIATSPGAPQAGAGAACFTCQLECNLDAPAASGPAAASAYGYSDSSDSAACAAAQSELASWAHGLGRRLAMCSRIGG